MSTYISTRQKAHAILEQVEQELGWMFETEIDGKKAKVNCTIWSDVYVCPSCGNEIVLWDESVDLKNKIIKDSFACPSCGFECTKKNIISKSYLPKVSLCSIINNIRCRAFR